jgi:predicted pyridoxine 5'-phosphate oxidase superfamily flavin-nucleotide-binding protein
MDASHRGGPAGFVDVVDGRTLRFPDYAGNDHFNTFGNLIRDPRIGLVFPDFERGGLLQLTGVASIDWTRPDQSLFPNAERLVEVRIDAVVDRAGVLPIRWQRAAKAGA